MKHKLNSYEQIIKDIVEYNYHEDFDKLMSNIVSTQLNEAAVECYRNLSKEDKCKFIASELLEGTTNLLTDIVQWDDQSTLDSCEGLINSITSYFKDDIQSDIEEEYNTYISSPIDEDTLEELSDEYMDDYISRTKEYISKSSLIY